MEDFHFTSFREAIKPFGFILEVANGSTFFLKIHSTDLDRTIASVQKVWTIHHPERPFEYSFQDELFAKLHISEGRFKELFSVFTLLAIFITCLGMFGLVTYMAERRTKEIGIRKVLGASVSGVVILLSKDFLIIVIIAIAIASPITYYLMNGWLQNFAYRVDINPKVFLVTAWASVVITLITVGFQSIKAALANPVSSLRNE